MATVGSMCVRSAHQVSRLANSLFIRPLVARRDLKYSTVPGNDVKKDTPPPEQKEQTPGESANGDPPKLSEAQVKLTEENKKLEENLKELKDKYMRSLAETENVRTRMKKQIEDAKHFGIQSFCKDLLDVADILGRATESVPKEELTSKNVHLKNLFDGLTMTNSELQKVFNKHGLAQIQPKEGDEFDPFIHEAMFEVPTPDKDMGSKIAVLQKLGYKLSDRTIRPAQVGVFKS